MTQSHIKGLEAWLKLTDSISQEMETDVKNLIAKMAYNIQRDAKLLVPVDSGDLRRSIDVQFSADKFQATIGTNMEYAIYVEFGTTKQPAQPYLIPAYKKWKPQYVIELQNILKRVGG